MPESAEDRVVTLLSHWLARHIRDDELRSGLVSVGTHDLGEDQALAVGELLAEFDSLRDSPGERERLVRETLEAVALA
jgi:hypothetical protein